MEDFPAKLASFLESSAAKVRSLTVERAENVIRLTALGLVAGALGFMAVVFVFLTIYGALEIPLGAWGAYGVMGGLFLVGGVFMWVNRTGD